MSTNTSTSLATSTSTVPQGDEAGAYAAWNDLVGSPFTGGLATNGYDFSPWAAKDTNFYQTAPADFVPGMESFWDDNSGAMSERPATWNKYWGDEQSRYLHAGSTDPRYQWATQYSSKTRDPFDDYIAAHPDALGQVNDRAFRGIDDANFFQNPGGFYSAILGDQDWLNDAQVSGGQNWASQMTPSAQSARNDPDDGFGGILGALALVAALYTGGASLGLFGAEAGGLGLMGGEIAGMGAEGLMGLEAASGIGAGLGASEGLVGGLMGGELTGLGFEGLMGGMEAGGIGAGAELGAAELAGLGEMGGELGSMMPLEYDMPIDPSTIMPQDFAASTAEESFTMPQQLKDAAKGMNNLRKTYNLFRTANNLLDPQGRPQGALQAYNGREQNGRVPLNMNPAFGLRNYR